MGYLAGVPLLVGLLLLGRYAAVVEVDLVVARDDHLVPEVEPVELFHKSEEVLLPPVVGEVPRVDEDVPLHPEEVLQRMHLPVGVRHHHHAQLLPLLLVRLH